MRDDLWDWMLIMQTLKERYRRLKDRQYRLRLQNEVSDQ